MTATDPREHGIEKVHLWAHDALLSVVPDAPWLVTHAVHASRGSLLRQIVWQRFSLPASARRLGIQAMFNTDAGSVCAYQPSITLSQDMLSFEPGEINRYPWASRARLRLEALRFVQLARLRRSSVAVFLTEHAERVIGAHTHLRRTCIIRHGIDRGFHELARHRRPFPEDGAIRCLYISNTTQYKHQWNVVAAVAQVRQELDIDLRLRLVGGGHGQAQARLDAAIQRYDSAGAFVEQAPFVPHDRIQQELAAADLFVFASSCENLPITLLEGMAAALPIASSDRGPMPEVLGPEGVYFDPEQPASIADAIRRLLVDPDLRTTTVRMARERAQEFKWHETAAATWELMATVAKIHNP